MAVTGNTVGAPAAAPGCQTFRGFLLWCCSGGFHCSRLRSCGWVSLGVFRFFLGTCCDVCASLGRHISRCAGWLSLLPCGCSLCFFFRFSRFVLVGCVGGTHFSRWPLPCPCPCPCPCLCPFFAQAGFIPWKPSKPPASRAPARAPAAALRPGGDHTSLGPVAAAAAPVERRGVTAKRLDPAPPPSIGSSSRSSTALAPKSSRCPSKGPPAPPMETSWEYRQAEPRLQVPFWKNRQRVAS